MNQCLFLEDAGQKSLNLGPDFSRMSFQGKVARVVEDDFGFWIISLAGLGPGRKEEWIVLSPYRQGWRLILAEEFARHPGFPGWVFPNRFGRGPLGAVEEASDAEIAGVFETNVFGLLRVTQAVLPHFRDRRSGHVVNLSSIGGLIGISGYGIYNSTKFAVEGLSESLAKEVAPLGIRVTIVEPGPFRTSFLGGSLVRTGKTLGDYDQTAGHTRAGAMERNGNQPGDPVRAAEAIIKAVTSENPPLRLLLGKFAYEAATAKLDNLRKDFEAWREVTLSSDFPETGEGVKNSALVL